MHLWTQRYPEMIIKINNKYTNPAYTLSVFLNDTVESLSTITNSVLNSSCFAWHPYGKLELFKIELVIVFFFLLPWEIKQTSFTQQVIPCAAPWPGHLLINSMIIIESVSTALISLALVVYSMFYSGQISLNFCDSVFIIIKSHIVIIQ